MQRADVAARLDAVALLEADVEDGHIRIERVHPTNRLLGGRRLADDLDVTLGLEQVADAAPHDLVIVEQGTP